MPNETHMYHLDRDGRSYIAVKTLVNAFVRAARTSDSLDALRAKYAEEFFGAGLSTPVTQIFYHPDTSPRAYLHTAEIRGMVINGQTELFMTVPVGYNGNCFEPQDAKLLDDNMKQILGSGGIMQPEHKVLALPRCGIELPRDAPENSGPASGNQLSLRCFIAQGYSFKLMTDYEQKMRQWNSSVRSLMDFVSNFYESRIGNEFHLSMRYSPENRLMVRMMHNKHSHQIDMEDNDWFILKKDRIDSWDHEILPNEATAQGRDVAKYFKAITKAPSLYDYPELLGDFKLAPGPFDDSLRINPTAPSFERLQGVPLIIYHVNQNDRSDFCPPDCIPLRQELYHWIVLDQMDRESGVLPPPMPSELASSYDDQKALAILQRPNAVPPAALPVPSAPEA